MPLAARPSPARLVLIRHGQSTWNQEHRIQGQLDPPLSDEGRMQARRLAGRLAGRRFAAFYASDLQRATETARIVAPAIGLEPKPAACWREIYLGDWEGLRSADLARRFPEAWARWTEEPDWDVIPGGEGAVAFETRVAGAIDEIFDRHQQGDILVVTHGGVIQAAVHRVVGRPSRGLFPFKIQNASISLIEKGDDRMIIGGVNDIGHLEATVVAEPGPG